MNAYFQRWPICFAQITGLQPLMEYSVNIRAKNTAGEGPKSGVQHFHLRPIEEEKEFTLDHDQLMGVFIGCGISVFCISLCLITIFCCKRKFEKRYLEREAGVHILSGREKHEMRILTRNSMTGCKVSGLFWCFICFKNIGSYGMIMIWRLSWYCVMNIEWHDSIFHCNIKEVQ